MPQDEKEVEGHGRRNVEDETGDDTEGHGGKIPQVDQTGDEVEGHGGRYFEDQKGDDTEGHGGRIP